ncbi:hypothetical protein Catovirus_1_638 [Catovirus CTV1]|uniref:FNIP repeat protein n=1 Tax=Catovirus CTV1 TaxID=1977631 RepID=A0A1V0SAA9_9VIRU|nr:hypothetical protein Catovirus_1_638 [Catovirus CTV1]
MKNLTNLCSDEIAFICTFLTDRDKVSLLNINREIIKIFENSSSKIQLYDHYNNNNVRNIQEKYVITNFVYYKEKDNGPIDIPKCVKNMYCKSSLMDDISDLDNLEKIVLINHDRYMPKLPKSIVEVNLGGYFNRYINKFNDSIKILKFGHWHSQILLNLPSSLTSLSLGNNYDYPLPKLPRTLKILNCGKSFDQQLNDLPESLEELYLGLYYSQYLDNLPTRLIKLVISGGYLRPLCKLPDSIKYLDISFFENNLIKWPKSLKELRIGSTDHCSNISDSLEELPDGLENLYIHKSLEYQIKKLPNALKSFFVSRYIRNSDLTNLPENLLDLNIGINCFPKKKIIFPDNLIKIKIDIYGLNQKLEFGQKLKQLLCLKVSGEFNQNIDDLPDSIETLCLSRTFDMPISKLPSSLRKLKITNAKYNHRIKIDILPKNLKSIKVSGRLAESLYDLSRLRPDIKVVYI